MSYLNADFPLLYCLMRAEYAYDLQEHVGELIPVAVFGVASIPTLALGFHVVTNGGAQFARLPVAALVHRPPTRHSPLGHLQLWDCFSYDVAVNVYGFLRGLRCRVWLKDGAWHEGTYVATIDWAGSALAESPGEGGHKCGHMIALDDGQFAIQPNNRILWAEPSFITRPLARNPGYRTNSHVWRCEVGGFTTEDSDQFFYQDSTMKGACGERTSDAGLDPVAPVALGDPRAGQGH